MLEKTKINEKVAGAGPFLKNVTNIVLEGADLFADHFRLRAVVVAAVVVAIVVGVGCTLVRNV